MKEQKIALTYARSIYQLGKISKIDLPAEMTAFTEVVNSSNQLENILFMDIFSVEEKKSVLTDIFEKTKWSDTLRYILFFLVDEKRIGVFPLIFKEITIIEDHAKGFLRGIIEGREEHLDSAIESTLIKYLEKSLGKKIVPSHQQNSQMTAGYRVTVEDLQLDASVENQLEKFKQTIIGDR